MKPNSDKYNQMQSGYAQIDDAVLDMYMVAQKESPWPSNQLTALKFASKAVISCQIWV